MYPISAEALAALRSDVVQSVKIACTPTTGDAFVITDKDIKDGSCSIEWSSVTGDALEIGTACMSELNFTLENSDGTFSDKVFEGAQLYVTVSFPVGSSTYTIPLGYYTVDSPPRKLDTIKITAYDRMAKFDRPYDTELAYPATYYTIVKDACTKCGVPMGDMYVNGLTTHNVSTAVPNRPEGDDLTYRQVIAWAAQMCGMCAYIDYSGCLNAGWYETNYDHHEFILPSDRFTAGSTDYSESAIHLTGVKISMNDENKTTYTAGTLDYALNIEGNLLAQDGQDMATIAANIKKLACDQFWPISMSCTTHSFPHLRPLDVLKFQKPDGKWNQVLITNVKWNLHGNMKLEARCKTKTQAGYATMQPFTARQQAIIEQTRAQSYAMLNDLEQATLALNETIANSMGLYVTRKVDDSGATITYYHDQPTLENSSTIYCHNAGGYAWTNDGWNDGSPTWQYGVSKDGDAVMRNIAANNISAKYITSDVLASPTGKFSFNLNTGHIEASDINITGGDINLGGGSLSILNDDGYKADLSSGYLDLYQGAGTGSGTGSKYLSLSSSALLTSAVGTGSWYSNIVVPDFTISGMSSKGVRIGKSGSNASAVIPVVGGLTYNWNTDYMLIEADRTRVRKCIETNEAGYNQFAGVLHHRSIDGNELTVGLGIGGESTAAIELTNVTAGTIPARMDLYASGTNGAGASLRIKGTSYSGRIFVDSGGIYAQYGSNTPVKLA